MADRPYLILRNRIERRLEKPRNLVPHAALFTVFSAIIGILNIIRFPMDRMDGVTYWAIFCWSFVVSLHTLYAYLRSGMWKPTRDQLIQEEILESSGEFELAAEEMVDMHERLSEDIQKRLSSVNKLAVLGAGYFLLWPGMLILLLILTPLMGVISPDARAMILEFFQLSQRLSLIGTLLLSAVLIPWRTLLPRMKSRPDLYEVYRSKAKREMSEGDETTATEIDEESEFLPDDEAQYQHKASRAKGN